ncbi:hypothetical protein pEaSNUABM38_00076 [Erwinia phage pEa_SNUABM_38]|nr:hypothetical protein pEaSNUABM38_00076 [Erwinia phage pEa_SNUABM_38]
MFEVNIYSREGKNVLNVSLTVGADATREVVKAFNKSKVYHMYNKQKTIRFTYVKQELLAAVKDSLIGDMYPVIEALDEDENFIGCDYL